MTEQELKKEVRWMKRVTKDCYTKIDEEFNDRFSDKWQRFAKGLMELGERASFKGDWNAWMDAMDLCIQWNWKYPRAEIWMTEPYADEEGGEVYGHIEDESFRFTA